MKQARKNVLLLILGILIVADGFLWYFVNHRSELIMIPPTEIATTTKSGIKETKPIVDFNDEKPGEIITSSKEDKTEPPPAPPVPPSPPDKTGLEESPYENNTDHYRIYPPKGWGTEYPNHKPVTGWSPNVATEAALHLVIILAPNPKQLSLEAFSKEAKTNPLRSTFRKNETFLVEKKITIGGRDAYVLESTYLLNQTNYHRREVRIMSLDPKKVFVLSLTAAETVWATFEPVATRSTLTFEIW